jgi:serine/threonine-protein kinase RsbW
MWEPDSGDSLQTDSLLDSSLESVDKVEGWVHDAATSIGFDEDELHSIGIAVRECMVNAVAHGNRYSGKKKVRFELWTSANRLAMRISDEGTGFDVEGVPDPLHENNLMRHSGRGLLMIRAFMDEFLVSKRSPVGTEIVLVKNLPAAAG